jgi:hypothetical protein
MRRGLEPHRVPASETSVTDEPDQQTTEGWTGAETVGGDADIGSSVAGDVSVSFFDHKVTIDDVEDAAKWAYRKAFGRPERVEPGGISIDIESHEEVTMRSSSVAHEDPPPPPPQERER